MEGTSDFTILDLKCAGLPENDNENEVILRKTEW